MAVIPGTALGLAMGWWLEMRLAANPLVRLLFPIPSIAFFPVVIFYRGLSEWGLLLTAAITPFLLVTVQAPLIDRPDYFATMGCWKNWSPAAGSNSSEDERRHLTTKGLAQPNLGISLAKALR
ncbi:MAG: hypothetical protein ACXW5W_14330 [Candidatus Binatia bacterium]